MLHTMGSSFRRSDSAASGIMSELSRTGADNPPEADAGDYDRSRAIGEIYEANRAWLLSYAVSLLGGNEDAEGRVQVVS
jgi:hypothetical protein